MKKNKRRMLFSTGLVVLILLFIITCTHVNRKQEVTNVLSSEDIPSCSIEKYSPDSGYRVVYDSLVHVWKVKSGTKTAEFDLNGENRDFFGTVSDMAIHPDGKRLVILSDENALSAWDIPGGRCLLSNPDYSPSGCDCIGFTSDGNFLFLVNFREAFVDVIRWPELDYITTGNLGRYRNSFSWENIDGKLIFVYEEGEYLYKIEFPDESDNGEPVFSIPQLVGD